MPIMITYSSASPSWKDWCWLTYKARPNTNLASELVREPDVNPHVHLARIPQPEKGSIAVVVGEGATASSNFYFNENN